MGRRSFLLAFFTLSALFSTLHARIDPFSPNSGSDPLLSRARSLTQDPRPDKGAADPPVGREPPVLAEKSDDGGEGRGSAAEAPEEEKAGEMERHRSADNSVAGGGVIIGGLATAIFAAVYCYIRVTRKRTAEVLK